MSKKHTPRTTLIIISTSPTPQNVFIQIMHARFGQDDENKTSNDE